MKKGEDKLLSICSYVARLTAVPLVAAGIGAIDQHKRKEFSMKNIYLILI